VLTLIDKRITPAMALDVVRRLTLHRIDVKGYFILGFPTETAEEIDATVALIRELRDITEPMPGGSGPARSSTPLPWNPGLDQAPIHRQVHARRAVELLRGRPDRRRLDEAMRERDEFNFSVNIQLSDAPIGYVRRQLVSIARDQWTRSHGAAV